MKINERLSLIINELYKGNKRSFSKQIGVSPTVIENVMGTRQGKPSFDVLEKICSNANISPEWLLTGNGDMLRGGQAKPGAVMSYDEKSGVPYYAVDFIGGFDFVLNSQQATPDARIVFPQFNRAECWVISSGDLIALRRIEDWQDNILYGEVYAIVTDQYRTVKRIRRSALPDHIRLVPENPEYDAQDIASSAVVAVFAVLGCAKRIG